MYYLIVLWGRDGVGNVVWLVMRLGGLSVIVGGGCGVMKEIKLFIWKWRGRVVSLVCEGRVVNSWGWLEEWYVMVR